MAAAPQRVGPDGGRTRRSIYQNLAFIAAWSKLVLEGTIVREVMV